eukprot:1154420-Pelagomonas_calceolata.AAC.3
MKHKIRSFAFAPPTASGSGAAKRQRGVSATSAAPQLSLCLANNSVEVVQVRSWYAHLLACVWLSV